MMAERVVPFPGARAEAPVTEDSLAILLSREHGEEIRWCPERGCWYTWNGQRWAPERHGQVFEKARNICRAFTIQTGKDKWGKHATVSSVERFSRTQESLVVPVAEWDSDPWLLGTPGGIVDLRDGSFRKARRSELLIESVAVDPAEADEAPALWLAFLRDTTGGDEELIRYLQRMCGYALTGLIREHALYFVYGGGGNGKGTFLNVLRDIMGSYVRHAAMEVFMGDGGTRHPTELAMLQGARLVTASENEQGHAWAEARIKALTGGDPITARFTHQNFFTFRPAFKLVIIGNHRPVLRNVDDAAKRRLRMIPFLRKPERVDEELGERLKAEYPAILTWMIDGCLDWQAEPMDLPSVVQRETYGYFEDQDALGQWIKDCCETDDRQLPREHTFRCLSSRLFNSWARWSVANGEKAGTNKAFSEAMVRRGFEKLRGGVGIEFFRIRLKPDQNEGQPYMKMHGHD